MTAAKLADGVAFARESTGRADDAGHLARALLALSDDRDRLAAELEAVKALANSRYDEAVEAEAERDKLGRERDEASEQNAKLVALLEDDNMPASWPGSFCSYQLTEECCWTTYRDRPCYQHGKRAILAEIKAGG